MTKTIPKEYVDVKDIEDELKFVELKRELQVRLHIMKNAEEEKLKELKTIAEVCKAIAQLKIKHGWKLEDDMRKEINKRVDRTM